ncbi:hypothetical protein [Methylobacterium mesophilicum]
MVIQTPDAIEQSVPISIAFLDRVEVDQTGEAGPVADAEHRARADIDIGHSKPHVVADIEFAVRNDDNMHILVGEAAASYPEIVIGAADIYIQLGWTA